MCTVQLQQWQQTKTVVVVVAIANRSPLDPNVTQIRLLLARDTTPTTHTNLLSPWHVAQAVAQAVVRQHHHHHHCPQQQLHRHLRPLPWRVHGRSGVVVGVVRVAAVVAAVPVAVVVLAEQQVREPCESEHEARMQLQFTGHKLVAPLMSMMVMMVMVTVMGRTR